ncbi:hypothetical protein ACRZDY_002756 [Klebsiella pneumoniae]
MKNEVEQIALQNDMSIEFVTWFFNEKKAGCGNVWFMMMAAMWEGWKGRSIEMDKLATENVALKAAFHPSDIPSEWTDVFGDTAVIEHDAAGDNQGHSISWSWVDNQEEVIKSVLLAVDKGIETPTTDRIVAGIKADGVGEFIGRLQQCVDEGDFVGDEVAVIIGAIDCGKEFCEQLREGAGK